jgi:hypothetical protein
MIKFLIFGLELPLLVIVSMYAGWTIGRVLGPPFDILLTVLLTFAGFGMGTMLLLVFAQRNRKEYREAA